MIEIKLYTDGAYIVGHDIVENCRFVSYAIKSCIDNCLVESNEVEHYQSGTDEKWSHLGLTYIKLTKENKSIECKKIMNRFKKNIADYIKMEELNIPIYKYNENINWGLALKDAKERIK